MNMMAGAHKAKDDSDQQPQVRLSMLGRVLGYVKRSLAGIAHWFTQSFKELITKLRYIRYSSSKAFNKAIENGDINAIRRFSKFADFDNEYGNTLLHRAAQYGYVEVVKALVNEEAANQPNDFGDTPLHVAARFGHTTITEVLAESGAKVDQRNKYGQTALHKAVLAAKVETMEALVKRGARIDLRNKEEQTPLDLATLFIQKIQDPSEKRWEVIDYLNSLLKKVENSSSAAQTQVVQKVNGGTGLHWAAPNKRTVIPFGLKHYLELLSEVDQDKAALRKLKDKINQTENKGNTALHWAVICGDLETVRKLANKQSINQPNDLGQTPLYKAALYSPELIELFVEELEADVNQVDAIGETPLHGAVWAKNLKTVQLLAGKFSAKINQSDCTGKTPLDLAKCLDYMGLAHYLESLSRQATEVHNFNFKISK